MAQRTQSSFQGYGHRVQVIRHDDVAKCYSVLDNRRVLIRTMNESLANDVFLNTVAGLVRQTFIKYGEEV